MNLRPSIMQDNKLYELALIRAQRVSDAYAILDDQLEGLFKIQKSIWSGGVIVELGVCNGRASVFLATVANALEQEYYGIDCFVLAGSEAKFRSLMLRYRLNYTLLVGGTSSDVEHAGAKKVPWNNDRLIDLLIIDASHTEPWFSQDCRRWLPLVKPGGYVYFDDWGIKNNGEALTAKEAIACSTPGPTHNPHWPIPYYGTKYTQGWEDLGMISRGKLMRKPSNYKGGNTSENSSET